jgi:hypothetical protein
VGGYIRGVYTKTKKKCRQEYFEQSDIIFSEETQFVSYETPKLCLTFSFLAGKNVFKCHSLFFIHYLGQMWTLKIQSTAMLQVSFLTQTYSQLENTSLLVCCFSCII